MINAIDKVVSPCSGIVEKVMVRPSSHVYEWEKLFILKTEEGQETEVAVRTSGFITKINVKEGDKVNKDTILADIEDDHMICGSD